MVFGTDDGHAEVRREVASLTANLTAEDRHAIHAAVTEKIRSGDPLDTIDTIDIAALIARSAGALRPYTIPRPRREIVARLGRHLRRVRR